MRVSINQRTLLYGCYVEIASKKGEKISLKRGEIGHGILKKYGVFSSVNVLIPTAVFILKYVLLHGLPIADDIFIPLFLYSTPLSSLNFAQLSASLHFPWK